MAKKVKSATEEALERYIGAREIAQHEDLCAGVRELLDTIKDFTDADEWNAIVFLRDYCQYLMAEIQDRRLNETKAEIAKLQGEVHGS